MRRPRRNRHTSAIRSMVQESFLRAENLIQPYFVTDQKRSSIEGMPGIDRLPIDELIDDAKEAHHLGIQAIILFPCIEESLKDNKASIALEPTNLLYRAIRALKMALPDLCVIADIALDPYSSDGHDGIVENGQVLNDPTVEILAQMSRLAADAGADMVAPSDMMDGRVGFIRKTLDLHGYQNVGILSYAAKYCSAFYGPFRDALDSAPRAGDKKSYQLNPANSREALLECKLDEEEGADILMVKPALPYLDIISKVRERTNLPVAAYQVSGEYAMLMQAGDACLFEATQAIRRAGAEIILTYAAKRLVKNFLSVGPQSLSHNLDHLDLAGANKGR